MTGGAGGLIVNASLYFSQYIWSSQFTLRTYVMGIERDNSPNRKLVLRLAFCTPVVPFNDCLKFYRLVDEVP